MSITTKIFGVDQMGRVALLYTMENANGAKVSVLDYGANIVSIQMPNKKGELVEMGLGFDTLAPYEAKKACISSTIGRYANRIDKAKFSINGTEYSLFPNENGNCLHGGREGYEWKLFNAQMMQGEGEDAVTMTYMSKDMEEGFPGNLHVQVTFSLDDNNALSLRYMAQSDKDTVINLTNHAYFNLAGKGDILDHTLVIDADTITQTREDLIPTGAFTPVANTPYDFRGGMKVGEGLQQAGDYPALEANGYDVNFCLNGEGLRKAATLSHAESGVQMHVITDQPGVQLYSGKGLDVEGHNGTYYGPFYGLALETQHYADSPNHPHFPTTFLKAGDVFTSTTIYQFAISEE